VVLPNSSQSLEQKISSSDSLGYGMSSVDVASKLLYAGCTTVEVSKKPVRDMLICMRCEDVIRRPSPDAIAT
jgi:hypothetical protein